MLVSLQNQLHKQFQDLEIRSVSKTFSLSPMHARNMNGSEAKQDKTLLSHSHMFYHIDPRIKDD